MRRRPDTLIPLEITILQAAVDLQQRGEAEFHGFAMAREIAGRAEARTLTGHGTLYKALGRMAEAGLLESRWEDPAIAAAEGRPRRRLYHVTGLGAQAIPASNATQRAPAVRTRGGLAAS